MKGKRSCSALLAENRSWLLTTGDRRSLVALATHPDLGGVCANLAGRLVCLETLIWLLVVNDGLEKTATAFAPVRETNQKLEVIFSERNVTNLENCLAAIDSYLLSLRREVGESLLYEP